ncbi:MAG: hypothetical protein ACRETT_04405, partial [Steroidobacteraceae bacterium]
MTLIASGDEVRKLLLAMAGQRHLPWPRRIRREAGHSPEVLEQMLAAPEVPFRVRSYSRGTELSWGLDEYPATRLFEPLVEGSNAYMVQFSVADDRRSFNVEGIASPGPNGDAGISIARILATRIYRFNAERFNFGQSPFGTRTELEPDASNLAEVLNALQGTRERFRNYCDLVREVFPTIQTVSVRPLPQGGGQVEILIWQLDPASNREDLATPLAQSGTG